MTPIKWIVRADIADSALERFIADIPLIDRVGFTHKPTAEDEIRILGYKDAHLICYAFLYKNNPSFGYIVETAHRGYSIAHQAMSQIIKLAKELGRTELLSEVFSHNIASVKLLLDSGFQFYGPIYQIKLNLGV